MNRAVGLAGSLAMALVGFGCIEDIALRGSIAGAGNAIAISSRAHHTCVAAGDTAKCWGLNKDGQLGDGDAWSLTKVAPVVVRNLNGVVTSVAVGASFSCALMADGTVNCWGGSYFGQVGSGTRFASTPASALVAGLSVVTQLSAGYHHACAIKDDGAVWCWGWNMYGQLGDGTTDDRATPVEVKTLNGRATLIAPGESHTCAAMEEGGVKCWGNNADAALGIGTRGESAVPPTAVVGIAGRVRALAAGRGYSCAVTDDGAVKCWGWNYDGQLGDGWVVDRTSAAEARGLSAGFVGVSAGERHTCAWSDTGDAWCWGHNWAGEVGDGTTSNFRHTPTRVLGLSGPVSSVTVGVYHTCALMRTGRYACWGGNNFGALGNGTSQDRLADGTLWGGGRVNCQ